MDLLLNKILPAMWGLACLIGTVFVILNLIGGNQRRALGTLPIALGSGLILIGTLLNHAYHDAAHVNSPMIDVAMWCGGLGVLLLLAQAVNWARSALR